MTMSIDGSTQSRTIPMLSGTMVADKIPYCKVNANGQYGLYTMLLKVILYIEK